MATESTNGATEASTAPAAKATRAELMKQINDKKMKCALDSAELVTLKGELEVVKQELAEYKIKTKEFMVNGKKSMDSLKNVYTTKETALRKQLEEAQAKQSPVVALTSPSGCAVLIVLILCITLIAMKKGFKISKGNTNVSIGEGDSKK